MNQPIKRKDQAVKRKDKVAERPSMNDVLVVFTNGTQQFVRMCMPAGVKRVLSTDMYTHPAWQGAGSKARTPNSQRFKDKYGLK